MSHIERDTCRPHSRGARAIRRSDLHAGLARLWVIEDALKKQSQHSQLTLICLLRQSLICFERFQSGRVCPETGRVGTF